MRNNPFFSVIIPAYNRAQFLKIALNSVLSQDFGDFELIVVDDGSTDNTSDIVNDGRKTNDEGQKKIKYIYQENRGPAAARNAGIKEARGEYICFLDTDDRFRHNKLGTTHAYIKENPGYKVFHTEEIWYRNGKLLAQKIYHKKHHGDAFRNALRICSVSISTAAVKKDIFEEIGLFDETMKACEDYEFWLRVTARYSLFLIPHYLTIKEGGHADQQSKKFEAIDVLRIYAIKKLIDSKSLSNQQRKHAVEELKRKCAIYIKGADKRGKQNEVNRYKDIMNRY